ncbi:GNAT family N-acetyltransferase [Chloroflexota bacterium]
MIQFYEEHSFNSWPSLNTQYYDGWLLRFGAGYTRRINSVNPLYPATLAVAEKIAHCEAVYRGQRLKPVFKITSDPALSDLDAALAARDYAYDALTSVQVMDDLTGLAAPTLNMVTILQQPTAGWLDAYYAVSGADESNREIHRQILGQIVGQCGLMTLLMDEQPVAVGVGVLERGYVTIFDVVVAEERRNQGLGTQLMLNLLAWGRAQGADKSLLQVMCNNPPALKVYDRLGYREVYRYWYRAATK